jgi:hypothetical protein
MLKVNDFITITENVEGVVKNSVGVIEEVIGTNRYKVFFVGLRKEIVLESNKLSLLDISKTGKPHEYKICNVCHILKKDFEDFEINQTDAQGRKTTRPSCRDCRVGIDGVKLLSSEKKRMNQVKPQKFFVCPICEKGSIPDVTANLVIDHNHDNGKAREWLCDSCNTGLGRFKDNEALLEKAIRYLKKYNQNN